MTSNPPPPEPERGDPNTGAPYPKYPEYPPSAGGPPNYPAAGGMPGYPPPGGMPGYPQPGGMPAYPQGGGYREEPMARPSSVKYAVLLMRCGAALSLLGIVVTLLTRNSIKDQIRDKLLQNGNYSKSTLDLGYNIGIASAIVGGLIAIGLWIWMAQVNNNGRKWARIVSTVLAGIGILGFLVTLIQNQESAISMTVSAVTPLLGIVILILMWRPESTAYYNDRSRTPDQMGY